MEVLHIIAILVIPYFIGSLNGAIIISRVMNLEDPREHGSKNAGATNVARQDKRAGKFVFIFDLLKGLIAIFIIQLLTSFGAHQLLFSLGILAVMVGHIFPIFYGLKGGKGVAVGIGVVLGINPLIAICIGIVWCLVYLFTKTSSLSALISFPLSLVYVFFIDHAAWWPIFLVTIVILLTHYSNIQRLLSKREMSFKKDDK